MTIRILAAGGTFDKHYNEIAGELGFDSSHLPAIVTRARITLPVQITQLPLLDSLDMKDEDRRRILDTCRQANEDQILIIHGTDTMRETAEVLGHASLGKTIVMTGAMIPYEIANSDALFNFGFAFGIAQTLPAGVYVAMNGRIFAWDNVMKNRSAGLFDRL